MSIFQFTQPRKITVPYRIVICFGIFIAFSSAAKSGELVYAVSANGSITNQLFTVDLETGETVLAGPKGMGIGVSTTVNIASRPSDGKIFLDANGLPFQGLFTIDAASGLATSVGPNDKINQLAFDEHDRLYTQMSGTAFPPPPAPIGIVNTLTGQATALGGSNIPLLFGLAYNFADGFLYGLSVDNDLYKISIASGAIITSVRLHAPRTQLFAPGDIIFDRNGTLTAADLRGRIFDIDLGTGLITNFRHLPDGVLVQGMARVVPEPSTGIMAMLVFGTLCKCRKRRKVTEPQG